MNTSSKKILWWGRFDPDYSRNRILRQALDSLGFSLIDFIPKSSLVGGLQARFHNFGKLDAVWVPSFRQSDFLAAQSFAKRHSIPLIFDPLISSWDKAVFERNKFPIEHIKSQKLLAWERSLFATSDLLLADTTLHAQFFIETLNARHHKTCVVPVGAEEQIFIKQPFTNKQHEVLFYGSFIHLQGPEFIVETARLLPTVNFTLLGEGPLKRQCMQLADTLTNVQFENWISYKSLPARIGEASILLGVFGESPKAGRVIPNKVYQALASGRTIITRVSDAYPTSVKQSEAGIHFVPPGSPKKMAVKIKQLLGENNLQIEGDQARQIYDNFFSKPIIIQALKDALQKVQLL